MVVYVENHSVLSPFCRVQLVAEVEDWDREADEKDAKV